jgi:hypothetical protein
LYGVSELCDFFDDMIYLRDSGCEVGIRVPVYDLILNNRAHDFSVSFPQHFDGIFVNGVRKMLHNN